MEALETWAKALFLGALVGLIAGIALEYRILHQEPKQIIEAAKPSQRQSDGSLILQRQASQAPAQVAPAASVPAGYHEVRKVQLTIQAKVPGGSSPSTAEKSLPSVPQGQGVADKYMEHSHTSVNASPATPCPPVHLNLDLVQSKAGDERVIASSPDGEVLGGVDIPVSHFEGSSPKELPWRAQALAGVHIAPGLPRQYGAMISRDVGPFSASLGFIGDTAFVGVGLRF